MDIVEEMMKISAESLSAPHSSSLTDQVAPSALAPSPRGVQDANMFLYLGDDASATAKVEACPMPAGAPPCASHFAGPYSQLSTYPVNSQVQPVEQASCAPPPQYGHAAFSSTSPNCELPMDPHRKPTFCDKKTLQIEVPQVHMGDIEQEKGLSMSQEEERKRRKTECLPVMPPTAKSIIERRAKAIKEGRREDAKLTDDERRILRRLRNRESAERCRLRRVAQANMLESRIRSLQKENENLRMQVQMYDNRVRNLEAVLRLKSQSQQDSF